MPILENAQEEIFCQERAKGALIGDAFVTAGYSDNSGNASRLNGKERIKARIREIQESAEKQVIAEIKITKEWIQDRLKENVLYCQKSNPTASNRALELLAKMEGVLVEKTEDVTQAPTSKRDIILKMAETNAPIAKAMAIKYKVDIDPAVIDQHHRDSTDKARMN